MFYIENAHAVAHGVSIPKCSQNHDYLFCGMRTRYILLPESLPKTMVLAADVLFFRRLVKRRQGHLHDCAIAIANSLSYTASFSHSLCPYPDTHVKTCLKIDIKSNVRQRSLCCSQPYKHHPAQRVLLLFFPHRFVQKA